MDVKTLYNGKHSVLFPVAAVSNYFKLTEFEQHKFIQSEFWRPKVCSGSHWAKIKVLAVLSSLWRL